MKLNMGLDVSQDGLQCSGFTDTWGIPNFNHHLFSSCSNPGFKCFSQQLQDHQYLRYWFKIHQLFQASLLQPLCRFETVLEPSVAWKTCRGQVLSWSPPLPWAKWAMRCGTRTMKPSSRSLGTTSKGRRGPGKTSIGELNHGRNLHQLDMGHLQQWLYMHM